MWRFAKYCSIFIRYLSNLRLLSNLCDICLFESDQFLNFMFADLSPKPMKQYCTICTWNLSMILLIYCICVHGCLCIILFILVHYNPPNILMLNIMYNYLYVCFHVGHLYASDFCQINPQNFILVVFLSRENRNSRMLTFIWAYCDHNSFCLIITFFHVFASVSFWRQYHVTGWFWLGVFPLCCTYVFIVLIYWDCKGWERLTDGYIHSQLAVSDLYHIICSNHVVLNLAKFDRYKPILGCMISLVMFSSN